MRARTPGTRPCYGSRRRRASRWTRRTGRARSSACRSCPPWHRPSRRLHSRLRSGTGRWDGRRSSRASELSSLRVEQRPQPYHRRGTLVRVNAPGAILLVACYELGHQPLAVAWPAAFLERRGYRPAVLDVSVEPFDAEQVRRARLVAISVPMHTALRLGVAFARRVRAVNPTGHIVFYGLYATLNADSLLRHAADSVIGGEVESALVRLVQRLEERHDTEGGGGGA